MAIHSAKQIVERLDVETIDIEQVLKFGFETLTTAAPALSLVLPVSILDSTSNAVDSTLANGSPGQIKIVMYSVHANNSTITPANFKQTTVTFDAANEYWIGMWDNISGQWDTIASNATLA